MSDVKSTQTRIPLVIPYAPPNNGMVKIGKVARDLGVSVQTIRLYETEGILISFRSKKGTRWYLPEDVAWICRIRELIDSGLNFAGIRHLLAQIPCWALKPCHPEQQAECPMTVQAEIPCWVAPEKLCIEQLKECYHCPTYRRAKDFVNLKAYSRIIPLAK